MEPIFSKRLEDGRVLCSMCARQCRLTPTETGWCGALERSGDDLVVPPEGTRFQLEVAPAESSGLSRFCPGTAFAAIRTRGSGLEKRTGPLAHAPWLTPEEAVVLARTWGCRGVYLHADDPVFGILEGTALFERARAVGLRTALRTSGYLLPRGREALFAHADAVEFRLFGVSGPLYARRFSARVEPVLDTISWAAERRGLWLELTIPLIPGENDSDAGLRATGTWISANLPASTPVHVAPGVEIADSVGLERAAAVLRESGLVDVEALVPRMPEPLTSRPQ